MAYTLANAQNRLADLRGTPDRQASVYNAFMAPATYARQNYNSQRGVEALAKLSAQALADLAAITADTNTAEQVITTASAAPKLPSDAAAMQVREMQKQTALHRIHAAFDAGQQLTTVAQTLLASGDRLGFEALRDEVPWLVSSKHLMGVDDALKTIGAIEAQLFTPDEKTLALVQRELKAGIQWVRQNTQLLEGFFQVMQTPAAVSGMMTRPRQVNTWPYLNETRPQGWQPAILLTDDFGGQFDPNKFFVDGPQFSIAPYKTR